MSERDVHEKQCRAILGRPFTEIHDFLDQYHLPLQQPFTAHLHRKYLHHWAGVRRVRQMYGPLAARAAMIHIREDCLGYIPQKLDYEDGKVDEYGRPRDQAKMNTGWFEKVKKRTKPP